MLLLYSYCAHYQGEGPGSLTVLRTSETMEGQLSCNVASFAGIHGHEGVFHSVGTLNDGNELFRVHEAAKRIQIVRTR